MWKNVGEEEKEESFLFVLNASNFFPPKFRKLYFRRVICELSMLSAIAVYGFLIDRWIIKGAIAANSKCENSAY